jgi:hypothetical protein
MFMRVNAKCAHRCADHRVKANGRGGYYQWTDEKLLDGQCRTKADITDVR